MPVYFKSEARRFLIDEHSEEKSHYGSRFLTPFEMPVKGNCQAVT